MSDPSLAEIESAARQDIDSRTQKQLMAMHDLEDDIEKRDRLREIYIDE